jgi:hypothetical protein
MSYDPRLSPGANVIITPEGGFAVKLVNATGSASVKGSLVMADNSAFETFNLETANGIDPFGVVYEAGVPNGSRCFVVVGGVADALLTDGTSSTFGNWVAVSVTQAGRVDANAASPPNQTRHFQEVGHCFQSVTAGVNKLCRIVMHFN